MSQDLKEHRDYELLFQDHQDESPISLSRKWKYKRFRVLYVLPWALNVFILSLLLASSSKPTDPSLAVYLVPAKSIIQHETVAMANDTASTLLDETEARQLPNQIAEVGPGKYTTIRKTIYPERYINHALYHPNGTINSVDIRHIGKCAGDVGTAVWIWRDSAGKWDRTVRIPPTHLWSITK
ncbi:hypothetical protein F5Y14DRAFT_461700 [Nemania sp. NC0429]|nr:hypothetical protein F5Y14DRAFT_461700 [Nemania sp. NC0429]